MALKRNQPVLTDDAITKIIIDYIDEDIYNYAIMIDCDWGCGKTYLVKEHLICKINEHEQAKEAAERRRVVYTSLYGVSSIDEISKQIIVESYMEHAGKAKGLLQACSKLAGVALTLLSAAGTDVDADNILGKLTQLLPVKNSIFIFDDLCLLQHTLKQ